MLDGTADVVFPMHNAFAAEKGRRTFQEAEASEDTWTI